MRTNNFGAVVSLIARDAIHCSVSHPEAVTRSSAHACAGNASSRLGRRVATLKTKVWKSRMWESIKAFSCRKERFWEISPPKKRQVHWYWHTASVRQDKAEVIHILWPWNHMIFYAIHLDCDAYLLTSSFWPFLVCFRRIFGTETAYCSK